MSSFRYAHKSIHQAAILALLITLPFSVSIFGASRTRAKNQKRQRAESHHRGSSHKHKASSRHRKLNARARRRAEAARRAAIARQKALDDTLRTRVQSLILRDDLSGEDPQIRRLALDALGNHAGTVVVMNPKTGQVYSIVNQQWAIQEGFKPCSTIKLITGLAGLGEKVIDPADTARITQSNQISLTEAMAYSKNDYFQQVGGLLGFDRMISYARRLGLGEKTGINVANEFQGRVPEFKSGFAMHRMSSHGDDFKVTAVQLATLVSAIANGGKLLAPIVTRSSNKDGALKPSVRRSVDIDPEALNHILPGMIGSVSYGSGRRAFDPQVTIAGKTGTCIEEGSWVGLFTSYAPLLDPKLAVVVITRGSDARNHFPALVAGRIYRALNDRFGAESTQSTALIQDAGTPPRLTNDESAVASDEDDEDGLTDSEDVPKSDDRSKVPVRENRGPANTVKRVLLAIPRSENSKPSIKTQGATRLTSQPSRQQ